MKQIVAQTVTQMTEQKIRFKVTVKKTYINDIITFSKAAINVANMTYVLVSDNPNLLFAKMLQ